MTDTPIEQTQLATIARQTFEIELAAIRGTMEALDEAAFVRACSIVLACKGKVVVCGVGKSGHIARKLASTLSSTGTPAFFLHPAEASHGDIGAIAAGDVMLLLSKSGESDELAALLPLLHAKRVPIVAFTAAETSRLARAAKQTNGVLLLLRVDEEACPHDLAPTASTTAMLALADAFAMALLDARKFSANDFARLHPAGSLGKRLTLLVRDLMISDDALPTIGTSASLITAMMEMSAKRLGATCVMSETGTLEGIITDGDLRRFMLAHPTADLAKTSATEAMTRSPRSVRMSALAYDALQLLETEPKVMQLVVLDTDERFCGMIHLHDIVRSGIGR